MKTFGLHVYVTRTVLPIVLLFSVHLAVGILSTENEDQNSGGIRVIIITLACIEALLSCYILYTKTRQLFRVPRLFFLSIPNHIDMISLSLGITLFFMVVSKNLPSRAFLAFSTLLIWVAAILMLRDISTGWHSTSTLGGDHARGVFVSGSAIFHNLRCVPRID